MSTNAVYHNLPLELLKGHEQITSFVEGF